MLAEGWVSRRGSVVVGAQLRVAGGEAISTPNLHHRPFRCSLSSVVSIIVIHPRISLPASPGSRLALSVSLRRLHPKPSSPSLRLTRKHASTSGVRGLSFSSSPSAQLTDSITRSHRTSSDQVYEQQNDERLDELHGKIRALRGVRPSSATRRLALSLLALG